MSGNDYWPSQDDLDEMDDAVHILVPGKRRAVPVWTDVAT